MRRLASQPAVLLAKHCRIFLSSVEHFFVSRVTITFAMIKLERLRYIRGVYYLVFRLLAGCEASRRRRLHAVFYFNILK